MLNVKKVFIEIMVNVINLLYSNKCNVLIGYNKMNPQPFNVINVNNILYHGLSK